MTVLMFFEGKKSIKASQVRNIWTFFSNRKHRY